MRIGLVNPYAWDVPGGVQWHVRDLAVHLRERGHEVEILTPAESDADLPPWVVSAGKPVSIPYNGSQAKLLLGPLSANRVRTWVKEGHFDVLHVHEPTAPSLSLLACWFARGPMVVTHHAALAKSRAYQAFEPILATAMERVTARIAVSDAARETIEGHMGSTAFVIPNGVQVDDFANATPMRNDDGVPWVVFVGRYDESRKGFAVLTDAIAKLVERGVDLRLKVAGRGDEKAARAELPASIRNKVDFLGAVSDEDKQSLLKAADVFVAPNLGGESFGIILVEAMAAGAPVIASDLDSFAQVLSDGEAGWLFPVGDSDALAAELARVLGDKQLRAELSERGSARARDFDWPGIVDRVIAVYETAMHPGVIVDLDPDAPDLPE